MNRNIAALVVAKAAFAASVALGFMAVPDAAPRLAPAWS